MKRTKKGPKKEEIAEDWCFVCKDGGFLIVCDYKHCLKAYHPECVGKNESFLETGKRWNCNWHTCLSCHKSAKFQCFCCPNAVCQRCITGSEFGRARGKKGFCSNCLKLALLVEENMDVDSDGERVDFKDRETVEGLFMEYYEIIKEKERLTLEHLHSADARLKKGDNRKFVYNSDDSNASEKSQPISEGNDTNDMDEQKRVSERKRSKGQKLNIRKAKSDKEFIGWGSKTLMQFLASIGKDTGEKLSHYEVTSIITRYVNENKLYLPEKKNKIICDARLQFVLGRKKVNRHRIHDLVEPHLAENLVHSEEEECVYSSEDKDENVSVTSKRQRKSSIYSNPQKKDVTYKLAQTFFAAIVAENIKLVYLKRSLVQELMKKPETFESQVTGSFVRVKSEPNDYPRRNSYVLAQVTGIKKNSSDENDTEILLQISNTPIDIRIFMLSDDEFSEEECEALREKVKSGLLQRPKFVAFEEKAKSLHVDITKQWIDREIALLQNRIDQANEKGWRNQRFEYMERRRLLQTPSEQSRLLNKIPTVTPDVEWFEPIAEGDKQGHEDSPKSILMGSLEIQSNNREGKTSSANKHHTSAPEKLCEQSQSFVQEVQHDVLLQKEEKQNSSKASLVQGPLQSNILAPEDKSEETKGDLKTSKVPLIELETSEDEDGDRSVVASGKQKRRVRKHA